MYTTDVYYLHFCQHHYIHHDKYNAGMCANIFKCLSALLKIILTIMMLACKKYFYEIIITKTLMTLKIGISILVL